MSEKTKIEWCDSSFNPWIGCTPVGPGCDRCYAAALSKRTGGPAYASGAPRRRTTDANWKLPALWNRRGFATCPTCCWRGEWPRKNGLVVVSPDCPGCGAAEALRTARRRVFCASLADVFDNEVDPAWRDDLWQLIQDTPNLDWLLLTKRIGNVFRFLPDGWALGHGPWPNVWLGATVVNQAEADRDIPKLLKTPAARRFLSIEPMLGPVDIDCPDVDWMKYPEGHGIKGNRLLIDWVIAGGESGHGARPADPQWFRALRDQCAAAGVPYLFKQWGEWGPDAEAHRTCLGCGRTRAEVGRPHGLCVTCGDTEWDDIDDPNWSYSTMARFGKKAAGRLLDGVEHNGFPEVHRG